MFANNVDEDEDEDDNDLAPPPTLTPPLPPRVAPGAPPGTPCPRPSGPLTTYFVQSFLIASLKIKGKSITSG